MRSVSLVVESQAILAPFLAMMLLTALVWVYMYSRRLGYIKANRIQPQDLATPEMAADPAPPPILVDSGNSLADDWLKRDAVETGELQLRGPAPRGCNRIPAGPRWVR